MLKSRYRKPGVRPTASGRSRASSRSKSGKAHAAGVDFAGNLAPEIQFIQTFSAAVVAGSGEVDNAKRLIAFFASPLAAEAIKKSGMEPIAAAR